MPAIDPDAAVRSPTATATASASSSSSGGSSPGPEPIAPGDPRGGLDRIAERAQLVDVTPDRARVDSEPVGKLLTGPFPPHLQEREERQKAS